MNILERCSAPVPELFRKLRNTGLILVGAGSAVLASQLEVAHKLVNIAGYITLAGGMIAAVSQLTVREPVPDENENHEQH
ncbi:hypothetical protein [Chryseobacterium caseinilyticum]|uniref:Holin n=1 Tax=Chryseobacterium caseinilyticum TaxID=2771428 RepID=A0ABR8ZHK0_9FLAO|nr:hypothetical protein [Chryseobacterium caseinilyticum]MBD8084554.1 hypothetical protein [Chryseobacterium caseinilyticum]